MSAPLCMSCLQAPSSSTCVPKGRAPNAHLECLCVTLQALLQVLWEGGRLCVACIQPHRQAAQLLLCSSNSSNSQQQAASILKENIRANAPQHGAMCDSEGHWQHECRCIPSPTLSRHPPAVMNCSSASGRDRPPHIQEASGRPFICSSRSGLPENSTRVSHTCGMCGPQQPKEWAAGSEWAMGQTTRHRQQNCLMKRSS
jgi:hypothetical protein